MKKDDLLNKYVTGIIAIVLLIQIGLVFFYNFRDTRTFTNPDAASATYHFMEVIKNGTLNIPEWNHTTTLELDSSFLLAVPIFKITKDIFLSLSIANIIFLFLYLLVIFRILYLNNVQLKWILCVMTLVVTPWAVGMLDYFNMLFYQASQYTVKTLVPLLLVLIVFQLEKLKKDHIGSIIELIITLLIYTSLLYCTALSTGTYTFICGIFPVIIGLLYTAICNKYNKFQWLKIVGIISYTLITQFSHL